MTTTNHPEQIQCRVLRYLSLWEQLWEDVGIAVKLMQIV